MKALRYLGPGQMVVQEIENPVPKDKEVLLKVRACGICGSDVHGSLGLTGRRIAPMAMGHEFSAEVVELGNGVKNFKKGDGVIVQPINFCGECKNCKQGLTNMCLNKKFFGVLTVDGAMAEYVAVPVYGLSELPDCISFVQGALIEPLAVAIGTVQKVDLRLGETVVIMGAGCIGLNLLVVAKAAGARRVVVTAISERRLVFAKKMGAYATIATKGTDVKGLILEKLEGRPDVILEATGMEDCIQTSLSVVKKGGKIGLAGFGRDEDIKIHIDDIHVNNLRIFGAGNNWNLVDKAIDLLKDGIVSTENLATHFFQLEEYEKALEMTKTRPDGFVKAVFTF